MEQKNKFIYILPVMFGFFIMGFCDLVGISVTYAKEQFQWTETQAGFLPSMVFLWFFILSVPTAMLMNRIGRKNTVLLSMLFTFAGMVLPFIDFSETSCYVAFALLGIGNTILQVSLNPLLANVVQGKGLTSSLTAGQFVKAISSFVGPLLAGYCSAALGNWALMFPIYAVVTLISSAWLFLTPIQREKVEGETSSFPATLKLLGDNKILLLFFGILCVVGLDVGMNTLTPKLLLERVPGISTESAGYGTSWYFAARTIGTFCGAFLLAKLSERGYFRINMIIAMIAVCGLWFATGQAAILYYRFRGFQYLRRGLFYGYSGTSRKSERNFRFDDYGGCRWCYRSSIDGDLCRCCRRTRWFSYYYRYLHCLPVILFLWN